MRARYYDPGTGRFISEDPSKVGGDWYVYCADNPVNKVDPTGKIAADLALLVSDLVTRLLGYVWADTLEEASVEGAQILIDGAISELSETAG